MWAKKKMTLYLSSGITALLLCLGLGLIACPADARLSADDFYPAKPDPLMGTYKGRFTENEDVNPDVVAQVIPLGDDMYRVRLVSKLFMRCPVDAEFEVEKRRGKLRFDAQGFEGTIDGKTCVGKRSRGRAPFEMTKYEYKPPTMGQKPPEGAIVLYDGTNLDQWTGADNWEILEDGTLMVTPRGKYLESTQKFLDVQLHVEFRTPYMPKASGQGRGNSGVFLQGEYEVQVLDSYGLEGYYDECGALYKVSAPRVNACAPPLTWQVYDITYRAARFDANGNVTENPRATVFHNGVCIQDDREMAWRTGWKEKDRLQPPPAEPGSIKLQGHNNYVQFRNVWAVDLGAE